MLPTLPMDRQHDVTDSIVDIDDNVGDQCSKQLLTRPHRHIGRIPGHLQIIRQIGKGIWLDLDG
jgi:hypothetical protein